MAVAVSFLFMAKEWAKAFYNSAAWKRSRKSYMDIRMAKDGGLCEVCHKKPGTIVHHVKPLTMTNINNPDIALNHDNFKLECKDCHDKEDEHFNNSRNEKKLLCRFDSEGNPLPL